MASACSDIEAALILSCRDQRQRDLMREVIALIRSSSSQERLEIRRELERIRGGSDALPK